MKIVIIGAVITIISLILPLQLFLRGLPLSWTISLLVGYIVVAILGYVLRQNMG